MLEANSEALENSGGGGVSVAPLNLRNEEESGGGSAPGEAGEDGRVMGEEGRDRSVTGNRWPREETLALLKVRSDMDIAFRDSTVKAPLWDAVSRKLAELGYHRSAKKCKEKFENIYKYHKRTKDSRSDRPNSKSYRFFEQLELLDGHSSLPSPSYSKVQVTTANTTLAMATAAATMIKHPTSVSQVKATHSIQELPMSASTPSTSSSEREESGGKKRKLVEYFERLTKEVLEKQESLQNKFIEAMERCEKDRIAREEAWKMQELARMKKQQEMVAQERAIAAAKDEAVIAFLRKISGQVSPVKLPEINPIQTNPILPMKRVETQENGGGNGGETAFPASSSRWPKAEVEALIRLRTNLDVPYQENGPKGPLWEEISSAMKKLGYDRSAKRCKEKWENINKYFKRTRDSNKKRPIDSKTCPYFHMLESLYEQKSKRVDSVDNPNHGLKPEHILMQMMVQQEQHHQHGPDKTVAEDGGSENLDQDQDGADDAVDDDDDDDDDGDDDDEDDTGDDYQVVANNPSSVTTMESMD